MAQDKQSKRLTKQHKKSKGVEGIFGEGAKSHDVSVGELSQVVLAHLEREFPQLVFRHRRAIKKDEINQVLHSLDEHLGQTLFVKNAEIRPDGGVLEVKDDDGNWRVVLVSEAKHQGKDIANITEGKFVGKNKDQDVMAAGNAIERSHKNISEMANFMLKESHFPYVLFLTGSNFLTETVAVERPDGRVVTLRYNSGNLNRIDRLTAANYGMPLNENLCENRFIGHGNKFVMLQAASIFTKGDGSTWSLEEMLEISVDVATTSLKLLGTVIFQQISQK